MLNNKHLMELAARAAARAAEFVVATERPAVADWDTKGQSDFATEVDRTAERIITDVILEAEPGSVIIGEELSPDEATSGLGWVVDPLDGTTNYLHGYPAYAVSVAAVLDGVLVAGAVHDIVRGISYQAHAGGGAWAGGDRLRVSKITDPGLALIGTGFPFKRLPELPVYTEQLSAILKATSGIRRAGSAALDLAAVASGSFDGFWELWLAPWDVAAGTLLVREAGGVLTDLEGSPDILKHGSIMGGNPAIHSWLAEVLAGRGTGL